MFSYTPYSPSIPSIPSFPPLCLVLALVLAMGTNALSAQDRTVLRHADPEAGGELVLESAPPSEDRRRALEAWSREFTRKVGPVRRAARDLFRVADPATDPVPGCRDLGRSLLALGEAGIQNAPHFAVRRHVDDGLLRLGRAVSWCLAGRPSRAHLQWKEAEDSLKSADRLLIHLGL